MINETDHLIKAMEYVTNYTVAIDGGANIGEWSAIMADSFDMVYSIEPDDNNFRDLFNNLYTFENVKLLKAAIGDEIKEVGMMGKSSTSYHVDMQGDGVDMITIDSLKLPSLGLLKLDLEGAEALAIKGGLETIKKFKPIIIVESIPKYEWRYGVEARKSVHILKDLGYSVLKRLAPNYIMGILQ